MATDLVVVAEYGSRFAAELARAALADGGVEAVLQTDDLGGLHPQLDITRGVKVVVRAMDRPLAERILADHAPPGN